jgi:hypothetical protein
MDEIYKELFEWLSRPPSGYGNHSCDACTVSDDCPARDFIEDVASPNSCSFYWPPNADKEPSEWYWRQLRRTARRLLDYETKLWITHMKQFISKDRSLLERIRSKQSGGGDTG